MTFGMMLINRRWYDWIGAVGGGGIITVGLAIAIWRIIVAKQ
jgi:hypothetical protein